MKQKKMTKRQLLNALLDAEEERKKIEASEARLKKRREKYLDNHSDLTKELYTIIQKEYDKEGKKMPGDLPPIIFKNHSFVPYVPSYNGERSETDIVEVNSVK